MRESLVIGHILEKVDGKWQTQRMDQRESERMLQCGGTRRRRPTEHGAADSAESTGFPRRSKDREGHIVVCVSSLPPIHPLKTSSGGVSSGHGEQQCDCWCAARWWTVWLEGPEQNFWSCQTPREAKVFGAHAAPNGVCDNLISALKLLVNQEEDGDSPGNMVVQGLPDEKSASREWMRSEGSSW